MGVKYIRTDDGKMLDSIYITTNDFEAEEDVVVKEEPHVLGDVPDY